MKPHPYAELFPMMPPDQLTELAVRIKKKGQRHKGKTFAGMLLDGRNREAACEIAGVEFEHEPFKGSDADALEYVLDENVHKRHLSVAVRAEIAAKIATMREGQPKSTASNEAVLSQSAAAKALGVSRSSVQRAASAAKTTPSSRKREATSWTVEELKGNDELMDLFTAISAVYGNMDAKAIRTGTIGLKLSDVRVLAKLKKEEMLDIKRLVMEKHWAPKKALDLLKTMPDGLTTNEEMQNYLLGSNEKKLVVEIKGFRHTCEFIS